MGSNLHFFDHRMIESEMTYIQSKINDKEATFMLKFAEYLLKNHYSPEEITILTLYSGQMLHFKAKMKNRSSPLSKIRVTTVDNFQGEENQIILLSLVRSNKKNSIGFLKVANRVCVALSRARKGTPFFANLRPLHFRKLRVSQELLSALPGNRVWPKS
jgi:superfamily I DNA and/or RNA helicase